MYVYVYIHVYTYIHTYTYIHAYLWSHSLLFFNKTFAQLLHERIGDLRVAMHCKWARRVTAYTWCSCSWSRYWKIPISWNISCCENNARSHVSLRQHTNTPRVCVCACVCVCFAAIWIHTNHHSRLTNRSPKCVQFLKYTNSCIIRREACTSTWLFDHHASK